MRNDDPRHPISDSHLQSHNSNTLFPKILDMSLREEKKIMRYLKIKFRYGHYQVLK